MIERLIQIAVGAGVGLGASAIVQMAGLQVRYANLLNTICILTGATAGLISGEAGSLYRRAAQRQQRSIATTDLARAIGRISEQFHGSASAEDIAVALKMLEMEVKNREQ